MTTMTVAPATTGDSSFFAGFLDGELAALAGLSSARATAIANMADPHDWLYAAGYWDGYLYGLTGVSVELKLALDAELADGRTVQAVAL